jgi:sRNA-binding protein
MTTYDRDVLVTVLIHHQRMDIGGCLCGWSVLGASHAEHIADAYEKAQARFGEN